MHRCTPASRRRTTDGPDDAIRPKFSNLGQYKRHSKTGATCSWQRRCHVAISKLDQQTDALDLTAAFNNRCCCWFDTPSPAAYSAVKDPHLPGVPAVAGRCTAAADFDRHAVV